MAISDIVAVSIAIQDSAPLAIAFDTPLVMAKAPFVGSRLYSLSPAGVASMLTDGFATYDRAYQIAQRFAGQTGGVGQMYVYSRTALQDHKMRLTVDITKTAVGSVLAFDYAYQGVTASISFTVVTNTVDAILDGFEALMVASAVESAGAATAPDNATATFLEVSADVSGDHVQFDLGGEQALELTDSSTADATLPAQLAAAKAELGANVYGLLLDGFSEGDGNAAAVFAEANTMLFLAQSADAAILDPGDATDIASDLSGAGYNRSNVGFTRDMFSDWAAGLMGRQLAQTPGGSTWAYKTIAGASADELRAADFTAGRDKKALFYSSTRGVSHTWDGYAASGRYFDITHGVDFLKSDIEGAVYQVFLNTEKVPFNATGLSQIEGALRGRLAAAEAAGLIEPGWNVVMPSLVGYSPVDKANRLLRTVEFSATLTGAVHQVTIAGTLTL